MLRSFRYSSYKWESWVTFILSLPRLPPYLYNYRGFLMFTAIVLSNFLKFTNTFAADVIKVTSSSFSGHLGGTYLHI